MRLYALYLTGALVATAIPLSAGAQPVQATRQTAAGPEQTTPTLDACRALYGNITVKDGQIQQSNYTDYLVPRIDITPETHVYLVENDHLPGGVGEPGVPPTAPAICNAIYAATGKRIRALPVDPQMLKA